METFYFLLFVAGCYGLAIDIPKAQQINLQAPEFKRFETKDDPNNITSHEIVTWAAVRSGDAADPVIGYKLKVWEVKKIKKTIFKNQDGEIVRLVEESYPKIDKNVIPDGVPKELITPANETTATFYDVQVGVPYQFAVLAFTAKGEGRLSAPIRIRLTPKEEHANLDDLISNQKETKYK